MRERFAIVSSAKIGAGNSTIVVGFFVLKKSQMYPSPIHPVILKKMSGFASNTKCDAVESSSLDKNLNNLKVSEKLAPKVEKNFYDKSDNTVNILRGNNDLEQNTLQENIAGVGDEKEKEKSESIVKNDLAPEKKKIIALNSYDYHAKNDDADNKAKYKYWDLVNELNFDTFPILLYQNEVLRNSIYTKIEEIVEKKTFVSLGLLFYSTEAKVLLNEMMDYWGKKVGYLKALKKIDEAMTLCVTYTNDGEYDKIIPGMITNNGTSDIYKFLTNRHQKLLTLSLANFYGYDSMYDYIQHRGQHKDNVEKKKNEAKHERLNTLKQHLTQMDLMCSKGMCMDEDMRPDMEKECEKLKQEIADYEKIVEEYRDGYPPIMLKDMRLKRILEDKDWCVAWMEQDETITYLRVNEENGWIILEEDDEDNEWEEIILYQPDTTRSMTYHYAFSNRTFYF